ncbi:hypothetical protein [Klebsiella pneumoniae]|uniref:hypothetical protein n=1 Tax=Klebsiella pneumoniae TaxID=573 RepID=UPI00388E9418
MAELNPPLGTTTPEIFLDNVKRADELVNGPAGTVNDRAGEPLDTWRQMMAKNDEVRQNGTVAKLAMRQPFVLFKGLTFQKLCLPGAFRPGDHHNKMLRPGLCVVHASPQYL